MAAASSWAGDGVVELVPAPAAVEGGELVGAHAEDGDTHSLQVLEGAADVEDLLGSGADDGDGGVGQLLQVGADVHRHLAAAVHAADAAGGKDADADHLGHEHGGGDGGRAGVAVRNVHGHVAAGDLADVLGLAHDGEVSLVQADLELAADDGHGGGHGAVVADDLLHLRGEVEVFGVGHAVAEYGALQGDNGLVSVESRLDLGLNVQILFKIHGM